MKNILLLLAVSVMLCGCTVIRELPRDNAFPAVNADGTPDAGFELGRKLLEAFIADDAAAFRACLTPEAQDKFTENGFRTHRREVTDSVGEPESFQYLTRLELPVFAPHIWKVRCRRTNRRGEEFHSEILFRIITGEVDGRPVIISYQFI